MIISKTTPYLELIKETEKLKKKKYLKKIKIAFLRDITVEKIIPYFEYYCLKNEYEPIIYLSPYSSSLIELENNKSELQKFNPNVIIIYNSTDYYDYDLKNNFFKFSKNKNKRKKNILSIVNSIINLSKNTNKNVKILFNNFILPDYPAYSLLDSQSSLYQTGTIKSLNEKIRNLISKIDNVYYVDLENLSCKLGLTHSIDYRSFYLEKNPYSETFLEFLSQEYIYFFNSIYNKNKKCLILDLDNTLWGGVIGEDGIDQIEVGNTFPGNIYTDFQRTILNLHNRGIVLAIASKNNNSDVARVFKEKKEMILKKKHFSAIEANWNNKVLNIKKISKDLNISLEHIVFIDDSSFEIEMIKKFLPKVSVIKFPDDPIDINKYFNFNNYFNSLNFTNEDSKRNKIYKDENLRKKFKQNYLRLDEYLLSLNMKVKININKLNNSERITQLINRTNQFNLTNKRYDHTNIKEIIQKNNFDIWTFQLIDRFGDQGIVGCVIIEYYEDYAKIDTFVLSCRAFGRNLEYFMLTFVMNKIKSKKIDYVKALFIENNKNFQFIDFYKECGFKRMKKMLSVTNYLFKNTDQMLIDKPIFFKKLNG